MRLQALMLLAAIGLAVCAAGRADAAVRSSAHTTRIAAAKSHALPAVTVTAKRLSLSKRVSKFVDQIAVAENGGNEGMPRWSMPVCSLVLGFSRQTDAIIAAKISQVARAAGVPIAREPCRPNLFFLVVANPQKFLTGLSNSAYQIIFGDISSSCSDSSHYDIEQFFSTRRAVKVWYQTSFTDEHSGVLARGCAITGPDGGSNLIVPASYQLSSVWEIADYERLDGVSLDQLSDYVAMVGLAKINPDAHLGDAPSILTLFDGAPRSAPAAMTDWDRAFLKALYSTRQRLLSQRSHIAQTIVRELRAPTGAPPAHPR